MTRLLPSTSFQALIKTAAVLLLGLSMSACIGSPNPRNPNINRRDPVKSKVRRRASVTGRAKVRFIQPTKTEQIILEMPKNSWAKHDIEVHNTVDKNSADKAAPIYPWFKLPKTKKDRKQAGEVE